MKIDRQAFLALALGMNAGCIIEQRGQTVQQPSSGNVAMPVQQQGYRPAQEGYAPSQEVASPTRETVAPAQECIGWTPTGECNRWQPTREK